MTPLKPTIRELLAPQWEWEDNGSNMLGQGEPFPKPPEKLNNYREVPEI